MIFRFLAAYSRKYAYFNQSIAPRSERVEIHGPLRWMGLRGCYFLERRNGRGKVEGRSKARCVGGSKGSKGGGLVVVRPDDCEVVPEACPQSWSKRNQVFGHLSGPDEVHNGEKHHRLRWSIMVANDPGVGVWSRERRSSLDLGEEFIKNFQPFGGIPDTPAWVDRS